MNISFASQWRRRTLLLFTLLGLLAFLFSIPLIAGCGGSGSDDTVPGNTTGGTGGNNPSPTPSAPLTFAPGTSRAKVIYVGNIQNARAVAMTQILTAHRITYQISPSVPDATSLAVFDALLIDDTGAIGPADSEKIVAYLSTGKAVVLVGLAPRVLATGKVGEEDTRAIASWFGGVREMNNNSGYSDILARSTPGAFLLPDGVAPGAKVCRIEGYDSGQEFQRCHIDADQMTNPTAVTMLSARDDVHAFAYETLGGSNGRVYWQWHPFGPNVDAGDTEKTFNMFIAGLNWASRIP